MQSIIKTKNLTKSFGDSTVVNDLSINIREGEIYGFLGPNGAGKSTTMKMLLGLENPTNGVIKVFGQSLLSKNKTILSNTGSLIEEPSYYPNLTGQENLEIIQKLMKLPKKNIEKALSIVRLTEHRNKLAKNYSLGMKQRLGIALALVKFPKLLILDEPTNGLDPAGIQEIRELIKTLPKQYGMTVMISSHLLSEIEHIATTVGIINHGNLIYEGSLSALEDKPKIEFELDQPELATRFLKSKAHKVQLLDNGQIEIMYHSKKEVARIISLLVKENFQVYQAKMIKRSLEEIFLEMTADGIGVL